MTPNERSKKWRDANVEKARQNCRRWYYAHHEEVLERQRIKNAKNKEKNCQKRAVYNNKPENKAKRKAIDHERNNTPEGRARIKKCKDARLSVPANRIRHIVNNAQKRALERRLAFDIALIEMANNPPKNCACCGIELDYSAPKRSRYNRSPSLDRIDNARGYTSDNVALICTRCNVVKSDATVDEARALAAYVERELTP